MPVTAKLPKLFYDRLGEQIANELEDWFNQVDASGRPSSHPPPRRDRPPSGWLNA
jgi:hypothetical protein